MDIRLEKGSVIVLPEAPADHCAFLFYVFDGEVIVGETMLLKAGENAVIETARPIFFVVETSDIVLFITDTNADHFEGGMYSGQLHEVENSDLIQV